MKTAFHRLLLASLLAAPGLVAASDAKVYGAQMPDGPAQSIAEAIDGYAGQISEPHKFSGRVAKVCRKKGCWMELESDGRSARVTMLDYSFFLPTDASGRAEVYGTLSEVELDEKTAEHYAKDAGTDVSEVARREFRIVAHAIAISAS